MEATTAALDYLNAQDCQKGYKRIVHQDVFEDGRSYVLLLGRYITLLFIDHEEDVCVLCLRRMLPSPDDAYSLFGCLKKFTSQSDYEAMGFKPLQEMN